MVDIGIIEQEILSLEAKDTTFAVVERLAWLYVVRDHLKPFKADARTGELVGSKFKEACSEVPIELLIDVLDEHMETLKLFYPKDYEAIIQKISALK